MTPLNRALRTVRQRRWLVAALAALGAAAGITASVAQPPVYAASAQLLVDTRLSSNGDFDVNLQNNQLLGQYFMAKLTSRSVMLAVAADEGQPSSNVERLSRQVSVQVIKGSDLLAVTATSPRADQAARLANEVAGETIALNRKEADDRFAPRRQYLDSELVRLDGLIRAEQDALLRLQIGSGANAEATLAGSINSHQARLNVLQTQYSDVYHQRQTLSIQQDLLAGALSVSEPASVPMRPVMPVPLLYIPGGALFGLVLGMLLALLMDRLDSRIRSADGLAEATGTAVSVTVDHRPGVTPARLAAAYSMAWATVVAESPTARVLILVEASSRDHAYEPAARIAEAAGRLNRAVVVFGGPEAATAASHVPVPHGEAPVDLENAPEGTLALPVNQPSWTGSNGNGSGEYDLVVTSVPAPSEHPVAMTLAGSADAAIVVATAGQTRLEEARQTAESLRVAGVPLVASILVHEEPEHADRDTLDREERRSA